ncbi:exported hypothetical protein [Nitrospira lenta]|uniref:Uncharacterized protein n=1 Tax=Nitrospira lenta TaxID=1436998 RepID=A0A330L8I8_9BACT|nr:exported hypothetical protein [Nitrospira lenta]
MTKSRRKLTGSMGQAATHLSGQINATADATPKKPLRYRYSTLEIRACPQ